MEQNVTKLFNKIAHDYDSNLFFRISAKEMISLLPCLDNLKLLDASTGTATIALEINKKYPTCEIEAFDISENMLKIAQKKIDSSNIKKIKIFKSSVDTLPYKIPTFDIITCGYSLFFYPNIATSINTFLTILKPNGILIFSSFDQKAFHPYVQMFLKKITQDFPVKMPSGPMNKLNSVSEVKKILNSQSYPNQVKHFTIEYNISIDGWWKLLNSGGFKGLLSQLNKEDLNKFKQEHLKEIELVSKNGMLNLNADTIFGIIKKESVK